MEVDNLVGLLGELGGTSSAKLACVGYLLIRHHVKLLAGHSLITIINFAKITLKFELLHLYLYII
jgi:hypothetical protein